MVAEDQKEERLESDARELKNMTQSAEMSAHLKTTLYETVDQTK